jgi:hypothetical protein
MKKIKFEDYYSYLLFGVLVMLTTRLMIETKTFLVLFDFLLVLLSSILLFLFIGEFLMNLFGIEEKSNRMLIIIILTIIVLYILQWEFIIPLLDKREDC